MIQIRRYVAGDRGACLAIFDSNVGSSFVASERADFEAFLADLPGPYFVLEDEDGVVACGGYAAHAGSTSADLCWGMVRRDRQGTGCGRTLVAARLDEIRREATFTDVVLKTSQETAAFYERFGFVNEQIVHNGITPGLHSHEMRLQIVSTPTSPMPGDAAGRGCSDQAASPRRVDQSSV